MEFQPHSASSAGQNSWTQGRAAPERTRMTSENRRPSLFGQKLEHGGCGLFDRTARHVDQRPVMPCAQLAGEVDLVGDRLLVDIGIGIVMGAQSEKPVLPDLHNALRACE